MIEILPNIDKDKKEVMYMQLYRYIKQKIEDGQISSGEKLPSIRVLAKKLGISVTTIKYAYEQLTIEGYLINKRSSGYYASDIKLSKGKNTAKKKKAKEQNIDVQKLEIFDENCFDFIKWKKCINNIINYSPKELLCPADLQGEYKLRLEISKYVFQSRGFFCNEDDIIIGAGTQQLLNILIAILKNKEISKVGFEEPGYNFSKKIFEDMGFDTKNFDIDDFGIKIDHLSDVELIYTSPSHQFPTGVIMSAGRRSEILKWAGRKKYIIEDDYDSELRYYGRPVPALKANDKNDRVIYIGSFSSTLLPSLRISYMILPDDMMKDYNQIKNKYSQAVSKIDQLTLYKFMENGYYQKHIKKIRKIYSEKSSELSKFIEEKYKDKIKILSDTSGLFLILELDTEKTEEEITKILGEKMVHCVPYERYIQEKEYKEPKILLYYHNLKINKLIETLDEVFKDILAT